MKYEAKNSGDARESNGVTQQQLAEQLGRPQSYVSKYEAGERRLDVIEFADVCAVLALDAAQFLDKLLSESAREARAPRKR